MGRQKRAQRLGWNLNSILNLITLIRTIGGGGWIWANTARDIDELQTRRTAIEQSQKDGNAGVTRARRSRRGAIQAAWKSSSGSRAVRCGAEKAAPPARYAMSTPRTFGAEALW